MRLVRRVRPLKALMMGVWGVTLLVGATGCGDKQVAKAAPPPREIDVVQLAPGEVRDTGEYLGTLLSRQSVSILPQVAGYVRRIYVRPGQKVEQGAPLIDVDSREASAALDNARAQRTSSEVNLEQARRTLARIESLYKEGLASAQELEQSRAQVDALDASTRAAAAQETQRSVQLQFSTVRAPFAGTMGDVLVRLGDYVTATTPLTSVAQADVLEVSVSVPNERAHTLQLNTPLEVLDNAGHVLLTSPVFFIAPQADPRTQLVEVKAAFRNTVGLRPSELVRARLVYSTRNALQLPALAVVRQSGQPFALLVTDQDGKTVVQRKPIQLGALGESSYVVENGLKAGDRVAVSSLQLLRDGAQVKVKTSAPSVTPAQAEKEKQASSGGPAGGSR